MKKRLLGMLIVSVLFLASFLSAADWRLQKELYDAIKKDDTKKITSILEKHPDFVKKKIKYHDFPIIDAAKFGSLKAMKLLIEKGANCKKKESETGNSLLHIAVSNLKCRKAKREAVFDYLIKEKKIPVDIKNRAGETPFNYAFTSNSYAPSAAIGIAFIELCDKYKANLDAQDVSGQTVLNYLAEKSYRVNKDDADKTCFKKLDIAKVLLEKGADVNLADKNKRTPLVSFLVKTSEISDDKKIEFVTLLMEYGAKNNIKSKKGEKALKLVDKKGELYKVLKKRYKKKKKKK